MRTASSPGPRRGVTPPPALAGFVLLLLALTAVSFAVGRAAGPVSPGLHRVEEGERWDGPGGSGGHDHGMRAPGAVRP
ncbi:hypothetical protein [Streptomyces sp. MUM 178J]|uniref:hypothetical protein n=1 Tax=Streptomyces sp. MUM 178J TaxID=2791991 RepID=UPI001F047110|nr:hypothetical protein [Streptomyces sp. MUM 178J]WRQ83152.1 hypothetical protein I3F59_029585 [Streptomyces sp. MUM 178J]